MSDDFLKRWARRKAKVAAETEPPQVADPEASPPEPAEERPDAEILAELGLPDPDTLKAGDDFKAFMGKAVPVHLRRRALQRLWVSDPVFANLDGLNDYDGDFTGNGLGPEGLKTAYRVGRGMLEHIARDTEPPAPADDLETTTEELPDPDGNPDDSPLEEAPTGKFPPDSATADVEPELPRPRRMIFRT